jgi:hypothetical protein
LTAWRCRTRALGAASTAFYVADGDGDQRVQLGHRRLVERRLAGLPLARRSLALEHA